MVLKEKLLKAMAKTSSQNPINIQVLAKGRRIGEVREALDELYNDHRAYSCHITKGRQTAEMWWIVGNVNTDCNYNQTIRARKLKAAQARIENEQDEPD